MSWMYLNTINKFCFFFNWRYFSEILKKNRNNDPMLSKYVEIPSLLPSILGPNTESTRPTQIYMGVGVLLLYIQ